MGDEQVRQGREQGAHSKRVWSEGTGVIENWVTKLRIINYFFIMIKMVLVLL